jgi:hypothetical protein
MADLVLKNFVPWPTALAAGIVEALAGPHGNYVMAARVHILSKVCRQEDGWNGLALDEFRTTPSELGAAIHRSPQYASRVLQVLKKEGWIRSTGVDGVWAIVPSRVYESVADLVMRKKRQSNDKKQPKGAVSTPIVIPDVVDVVPVGVGSGVIDGVAATPVKHNGGAGSQPPQEDQIPENKIAGSFSLPSLPGGVCANEPPCQQGDRETSPATEEEALAEAKEVMAAFNAVAAAKGIPLLSEEDFNKLLPEILAVIANPEGYPFGPAVQGMWVIPPSWFKKFQADYKFTFLLEKKSRKTWTEKVKPGSTAATGVPKNGDESTGTADGRISKKGPRLSLEEDLEPEDLAGFERLCIAYGNSLRIRRESDGRLAADLVKKGEVTWEGLRHWAEAQADSVSGPERIQGMTKWLSESKPWRIPPTSKKAKSHGIRSEADAATRVAKQASNKGTGTDPSTPVEVNIFVQLEQADG